MFEYNSKLMNNSLLLLHWRNWEISIFNIFFAKTLLTYSSGKCLLAIFNKLS